MTLLLKPSLDERRVNAFRRGLDYRFPVPPVSTWMWDDWAWAKYVTFLVPDQYGPLDPWPKKIHALDPREREQPCNHPFGFPHRGIMPLTGVRRCPLCGTIYDPAVQPSQL